MNSALLTVGSEEYRLKMNTAVKIDAEKKLGQSLLRAQLRMDETEVFSIILWAALQQYNHGMTIKDTLELIDEMEEKGCKYTDPGTGKEKVLDEFCISDREGLVFAILKVSGFFTKAELESLNELEAETKPKTRKKKATSQPPS